MMRSGMIIAVLVVIALGILFAVPMRFRTERHFTCLKCRAERWDRSILGHRYSTTNDSEYTPWYSAHFPAHQHIWCGESTAGYDIFGRDIYCGYSPSHPVALNISPSMQRQFAEFASRSNLVLFYEYTLSTNRDLQQQAVDMVRRELDSK